MLQAEIDKLDEYIDSLGIEYKADFVPFSRSRNKNEKMKSLNWIVTLKKNGVELSTDYMQGQAHVKGYNVKCDQPRYKAKIQTEIVTRTCEEGRRYFFSPRLNRVTRSIKYKRGQPKPELKDVLYSLSIDSDVLDFSTFEDWASEFGYEADSREAEKIYRACLEIALRMRSMFGDAELSVLMEAFQDY